MTRIKAAKEMYTGIVGRVVDVFRPYTEADPVAVAAQFLVAFGSAVGRGPHVRVGETLHHTNEALCLVGASSRARKGDSANIALRTLRDADPDWARCIASGLSSGEGLIHAVRDPILKEDKNGEPALVDAGAADRRLLVYESEFSGPLKQFSREGNTLSNVLRDGWDGRPVLRTLTKQSPTVATDAHISIIAHSTPTDLARYLGGTEAANGLGNRFMFLLVHRDKLLPTPGRASREAVAKLAGEVRTILERARGAGELRRTPAAADLWAQVYGALTEDKPGLLGPLLARSEAHVTRLSLLYALLDGAQAIDVAHVESALAFFDAVEDSTALIFADRTGNKTADRLRAGLQPGETMPLDEIRREIFANHVSAGELAVAIDLLAELGEVTARKVTTGGRPSVVVTRLDRAQSDGKNDPPRKNTGGGAKSAESAESPQAA